MKYIFPLNFSNYIYESNSHTDQGKDTEQDLKIRTFLNIIEFVEDQTVI